MVVKLGYLTKLSLKSSIYFCLFNEIFLANYIHQQESQERRRIHIHQIALIHTIQHASENEEHRKEHGIASSLVAQSQHLGTLIFANGKEMHQTSSVALSTLCIATGCGRSPFQTYIIGKVKTTLMQQLHNLKNEQILVIMASFSM